MWVNDIDPITFAIWEFLTSPEALVVVEAMVPEKVTAGDTVSNIVSRMTSMYPVPQGLVYLLQAEAHMGTQGTRGHYDKITSLSAICWNRRLKRRLRWLIPRIAHWRITNWDYRTVFEMVAKHESHATVFIDPPYAGAPGRTYRHEAIDYEELGRRCQWLAANITGQVVVCENTGATWLPFQPLTDRRIGFNTQHKKTSTGEAIWIKS